MQLSLPLDVWLYIIRFIPDATLRGMLAVNVFFYNISMDMKYKTIKLQKFNEKTMKLLSRLA
jgi:hypothetical protein